VGEQTNYQSGFRKLLHISDCGLSRFIPSGT